MCVCVCVCVWGGGGGDRYYVEQRVPIYNTFMYYMLWKRVTTSFVKVLPQEHHVK
jgi:hypothetical protein